jgi:hypothetical protein
MALAIGVVNRVAWFDITSFVAVVAIKKAFCVVAFFVAYFVLKEFPTSEWRCAIGPRADTQRTITSVKITSGGVAIFIANTIASLVVASLASTLNLISEQFFRNAIWSRF